MRRPDTLHAARCRLEAAVRARPHCYADLTDVERGVPEVECWECSRCGGSYESVYGCYEYCPRPAGTAGESRGR